MVGAFENSTAFNKDIESWDTNEVIKLRSMFIGSSTFNQNLSKWCVKKFPWNQISFRLTLHYKAKTNPIGVIVFERW